MVSSGLQLSVVGAVTLATMPKVDDLARLFTAIASHDWNGAQALAAQIAKREEESGHHGAAQLLRGALRPNLQRTSAPPSESPPNVDGIARPLVTSLTRLPLAGGLGEVRLRPNVRRELSAVVKEWQFRHTLQERGLHPRSKLLFHGPPGCGKSRTARALAHELSLPAFVVRLDAVVGAYLGQTALRVRELFRFTESTPCVLLLDEVDALGKSRGRPQDAGELDRVVITLMQELEHSQPKGLLIATSNLPGQLDEALWRRFDLVVDFPRPTASELKIYTVGLTRERGVRLSRAGREMLSRVRSYAEAEKVLEDEQRRNIIQAL